MKFIHCNEEAAGLLANLGAESGLPFKYPQEHIPADIAEVADGKAKEDAAKMVQAFLRVLTTHLLTAKNPRLELICLCYLSGFDMMALLGVVDNTQLAIARKLRVSKQSFQEKCVRVAESFGIDYVTANRGHRRISKRKPKVRQSTLP